jgi:hypothetical protein
MPRPRVLVVELVTAGERGGWFQRRVFHPSYHGVMPSVVAVWAREAGADVTYRIYIGAESPARLLAGEWDVAFVSSFTRTAWTAYTISHHLRARGVVTALGGPHAHSYPEDSRRWFDYVLGFTDEEVVRRVVHERAPAVERGRYLAAKRHPSALPGLRARAPFVEAAVRRGRIFHAVPTLASLGCPYTCDFCSDAEVAFKPLSLLDIEDDVRFARLRWPTAMVFWHDPNFGVRFDETLAAVEQGLDGERGFFGAESSLSLLSSPRLARMRAAGFTVMVPGIESWFDYGRKCGADAAGGRARMEATASHILSVLEAIPYVQVNFIVTLHADTACANLALTREFIARCPAAWPNMNLVTAFGQSSPLSRTLAAEGRILDVPFPLLDTKTCWNLVGDEDQARILRNLIGLLDYVGSVEVTARRVAAARGWRVRAVNLLRTWGGHDLRRHIRWYRRLLEWTERDSDFRDFVTGQSPVVPRQLLETALEKLGPFREMLPPLLVEQTRTGCRTEPLVEHGRLESLIRLNP